jgi:phytoene synthase
MNDPPADHAIVTLVRRHDPDRFLTALFAPPDRRDALLTLYAFNHELARAREVVSEPPLALIRLQWWREVVEGARRRHEVAEPLTAELEAGRLHRADLLALIEAREQEADPAIDTLAEWRAWLLAGAGGLAVAAARLLGATDPEPVRPYGAAYGVAGVLRSVPVLAAAGRCLLPADLLAAERLSHEAVIAEPNAPAVQSVLRCLVQEGLAMLRSAGAVPKPAVAAALPAVLARRDLARWPATVRVRGLGDRLAVTWAGLRGRA